MSSDRLHSLTVVVTGSSPGLGRGIALALAAAGAQLVICIDLKETQHARSTMDPVVKASKGAEMASRALEVANKDGEDDADTPTHELIRSRYGEDKAFYVRCDISLEQDDVDSVIYSTDAVDVTGTFLATKLAMTQCLKQDEDKHGFRGNIINILSIAGSSGLRGCSAYCAAKSAILGFTRSIAVEYAERKIRCNAIKPGYIITPLLQRVIESTGDVTWLEKVSLFNTLGQPKDIGNAVVWLATGRDSRSLILKCSKNP